MPSLRRTSLLLAASLSLLSGCSATTDDRDRATPDLPLASVGTDAVPVERAEFCDALSKDAVATALGGPASGTDHYGDGDTVEISPGVTDVAHEFNCTFVGADGSSARAWVFAPPVTRARAAELAERPVDAPDCAALLGAPLFGDPTSATRCERNGRSTVSFRGLFGDAWLTCEVTVATEATDVQERADRWCVAVIQAMEQT